MRIHSKKHSQLPLFADVFESFKNTTMQNYEMDDVYNKVYHHVAFSKRQQIFLFLVLFLRSTMKS